MKIKFIIVILLAVCLVFVSACSATVKLEEYNSVKDQLTAAQTEITSLSSEKTAVETELSAAKTEIANLNTQLAAEKSQAFQYEERITTLLADIDKLNDELDASKAEIKSLNAEVNNLTSEVSMLTEELTPSPAHAIANEDVFGNPEFASTAWKNRDWQWSQKVEEIGRTYYNTHTYIVNETDCNDMTVDIWNMLLTESIVSVIAIGNPEKENADFADCNHTWLLVFDAQGKYAVLEPTSGQVFYSGDAGVSVYLNWSYLYTKPSDLREDCKYKW